MAASALWDSTLSEAFCDRRNLRSTGGTDKRAGFFPSYASRLAERFLGGHNIDVADEMKVRADLEKLVGLDEAWSFCIREPKPGWRFLGRFVDNGVFVASVVKDRHQLASVPQYTAIAQAMVDDWNISLSTLPVLRCSSVEDYPTGIVTHVKRKK